MTVQEAQNIFNEIIGSCRDTNTLLALETLLEQSPIFSELLKDEEIWAFTLGFVKGGQMAVVVRQNEILGTYPVQSLFDQGYYAAFGTACFMKRE